MSGLKMMPKRKNTVSACLIVKNEEQFLPDCLTSIKGWVDEIIVVDTGSTDRTVEIAKSFGAKIFHQKWQHNFSFHRNFSMTQATKKWVFILDADERIFVDDGRKIKKLLKHIKQDVVSFIVCNVRKNGIGGWEIYSRISSLRLFRRSLNLQYEGAIHNQLILNDTLDGYRSSFRIYHLGYDLDLATMKIKQKRRIEICKKSVKDEPQNPITWFNYAKTLKSKVGTLNRWNIRKLIRVCKMGLTLMTGKEQKIVHLQLLTLMAQVQLQKKDYNTAIGYGKEALMIESNYLDAIFVIGYAYIYSGKIDVGKSWLQLWLEKERLFNFNKMNYGTTKNINDRVRILSDLMEMK